MTAYSTHAVLPLALLAGTMMLTVAACGGTAGQTSPSTGSRAPTAAPSSAPGSATSAAPVTSPTPGSGDAPSDGTCGVATLRVRYADDEGGAGAGNVTGTLTFTNTGSSACTLTGFPGVSYVGAGNGTQIGQAATRTDDPAKKKTLEPGTSVRAALRRTQPRNYGSECRQTDVDGLRVYPPGSTGSAFVALKTVGCENVEAPLLQVGPVR